MKRFRRWLFNWLAGASVLLCVATAVMWTRSYWRFDEVRWTHDKSTNEHLILLRCDAVSLRGGCAFGIEHSNASGKESIHDLADYFRWHPHGFEISSDPVQALDALNNNSWQISYRFKPTSPSPLGFQTSAHSGRYKGNDYWTDELAIPYWLPEGVFALIPLWWLRCEAKNRRKMKFGICAGCGYDLRATPSRCPECGTIPPKKEIISN